MFSQQFSIHVKGRVDTLIELFGNVVAGCVCVCVFNYRLLYCPSSISYCEQTTAKHCFRYISKVLQVLLLSMPCFLRPTMYVYFKDGSKRRWIADVHLKDGFCPCVGKSACSNNLRMEPAIWFKVLVLESISLDCGKRVVSWSTKNEDNGKVPCANTVYAAVVSNKLCIPKKCMVLLPHVNLLSYSQVHTKQLAKRADYVQY